MDDKDIRYKFEAKGGMPLEIRRGGMDYTDRLTSEGEAWTPEYISKHVTNELIRLAERAALMEAIISHLKIQDGWMVTVNHDGLIEAIQDLNAYDLK